MMTAKASEDARLIEAVETELHHLRNELHTDVCQTLVGVALRVEVMLRAMSQNEPIKIEQLISLKKGAGEAIDRTRALLRSLNPREPEFEGFALMNMLQELATERSRHIACEFRCARPVSIADDRVAHALFRIAQECCRADLIHLQLKRIQIHLFQERDCFRLEVRYEGENLREQKGLRGSELMHARARSVGGEVRQQSEPSHTKIVCTVPLSASPLKSP